MKLTLKKFVKDPYKLIEKAPLVILVNREPKFAIIPYVIYKNNIELIHENTFTQHTEILPPKPHGRLWRLFFE